MSAFTREQLRFGWAGIRLTQAIDDLPAGKYGFAQNVRSYAPDQITARPGNTQVAGSNLAAPVTGIERFDDPTPFSLNPHLYFAGGGVNLYQSVVGSGVFNQIDTGYSGNPLSFLSATPPQAAQPWLYVFDRNRARKVDSNGHVFRVGIAPPTTEPTAALQQIGANVIDIFSGAFIPWQLVGSAVGPITTANRSNTTIFQLLHDNNHSPVFSAPTYASIVPTSINGVNAGMMVGLDASETVVVTDVTIAVSTTIIAAIIYDAGNTGYCTIQPLGSLGTGQLEAPSQDDYAARYAQALSLGSVAPPGFLGDVVNRALADIQTQANGPNPPGLPPEPDVLRAANARIRQVDFPVNCLVGLGASGEIVRIESVAVGPDGIQSFRCFTTVPHVTGESITGIPAIRCYVTVAHTAGETFQDIALEHTLGPGTDIVGGIRTGAGWATRDLSRIYDRATLPDDDLRLSCRVSLPDEVETIRVYLSTNPTGGSAPSDNDFLTNYYFFEWRKNDIAAAVQGANAAIVESLQDTRFQTIGNAQVNQDLQNAVNQVVGDLLGGGQASGTAASAAAKQLQLGNTQWFELSCKVRDLQRIGTDPSTSLSTITAAELIVHMTGTNPITVDWDGLVLTGGYGPDTGTTAIPYVAMYRYRSSLTGAVSNFSPPLRGGVPARRQRIAFNHTVSPDAQADLVDWFVLGATLNRWTYAGSVPMGGTFFHDFSDSAISGGESADYNNFPPFPTQDAPRVGVCSYAGNAVIRISGDAFNTNWTPGSEIIIGEQTYTLYSQPPSANLLFTNENIGNQNNVPFTVKGATLLNQQMSSVWGGPIAGATFMFACGDPINPGQVHWTNGNNPESASDKNALDVSTGDEPLQAGFMDDGVSYVASTERIIRLEPTFGQATPFTPLETDCHRGFWNSYAFDRGIKGTYFLTRDGIAVTRGGSAAVMITDEDLYPLFPHDGVAGVAVNNIQPPDMTQGVLFISCDDGWVYFDYKDILGAAHTLAYRELDGAWHYDTYGVGVNVRTQASGLGVHQMLLGGLDGKIYVAGGQDDNGSAINCQLQWVQNQKDARRQKLYRDLMLDGQNLNPVNVTIGFTNNGTTIGPTALGAAGAGRTQQLIDATLQFGNFGTNLTTTLQWNPQATPTILYAWDIAFQPAPELATSWLSGPTTHGFRAFQQVYQVLVPMISNSVTRLSVTVDGVTLTYNIPSTGGVYAKIPVILQAVKGLTWQYALDTAGAGFMLFDQDFEAWVSVWGTDGDYQIVRPF